MRNTPYYSVRSGQKADKKIELYDLSSLFFVLYKKLNRKDYFYEYFGFDCVDMGYVEGKLGDEEAINSYLNFKLKRSFLESNLWPIENNFKNYTKNDLFDIIEFLHDHISIPSDGYYHGYNNCGMHDYKQFDSENAKIEYRAEVNNLLKEFENGYELSETGEILSLIEKGYENLFAAVIPSDDSENINNVIDDAIFKFRKARNIAERREAIRLLADILEFLRPNLKEILPTQDEKDLFNIINNFSIRHHNQLQRTNYDKPVWYNWMFYTFLSTIHLALRLIEKNNIEIGRYNPSKFAETDCKVKD